MTISTGSWQLVLDSAWLLAGAALLLLVLAGSVIAAWRRLANRSAPRWTLVTLLNLMAVTALLLLLAPPAVTVTADRGAVLVTEGATNLSTVANTYLMPGADGEGLGLLDPAQLPLRDPSLARLKVTGHGLLTDQWAGLAEDIAVDYEPPGLETLADLAWERAIPLGSALTVTGTWRGSEDIATVRLLDPMGLVADETRVSPGQTFRLSARPRAAGAPEYRLEATTPSGWAQNEPLAMEVNRGQAVRLAIIQSAPSFETRQLKNWAADYGSGLTMLTVISRDRAISQSVNLEAGVSLDLSPDMLAAQDLVVMDGRSLAAMNELRLGWLDEAVRGGLGLVVLADADLAEAMASLDSALLTGFSLSASGEESPEAVPVFANRVSPGPLPTAALTLGATGSRALVVSETGVPLDLFRHHGLGRVAMSILRERHAWLTAGQADIYSGYWAHLLRELARPPNSPRLGRAAADVLETPGVRTTLCAERLREPAVVRILPPSRSGLPATDWPLAADALGSSTACTAWWPASAGWHELTLLNTDGEILDRQLRRVFAENEWLGARRYQRQQATLQRASLAATVPDPESGNVRMPLGPLWPWLLFVLSASALWLERKLDFDG